MIWDWNTSNEPPLNATKNKTSLQHLLWIILVSGYSSMNRLKIKILYTDMVDACRAGYMHKASSSGVTKGPTSYLLCPTTWICVTKLVL